jgi:HSP20 family protein
MLIVRGERQSDFEDKQEGYYRTERSYGSFYRAIPLPNGVDPDACNATFKDGVLEVTLPKPPQAKSTGKQIQIR